MITNVAVFGSGLTLEDGEVAGLSPASQERAEYAAQLNARASEDKHFSRHFISPTANYYFTGAYPRLPRGVWSIPYEKREGPLMKQLAVSGEEVPYPIDRERARVECLATSTAENVEFVLREITGGDMSLRGIQRAINRDRQLGLVAGPGQMGRIIRNLRKIARVPREGIMPLPTSEPVRVYDRLAGAAFYAGSLLIPAGNVGQLKKLDAGLGALNDGIHTVADFVGDAAALAKGFVQKTTTPRQKVVS